MIARVTVGAVATIVLLIAGQLTALDHQRARSVAPATAAVSGMPPQAPTILPAAATASASAVPVVPRTTVAATSTTIGFVSAPAVGAGLPSWRVTDDGVPYFAGRPACTVGQASLIASGFADAGASVDTRWWAVYVASRESGCDHTAVNTNTATRDRSVCMHQLNAHPGGPLAPGGVLHTAGWTIETAAVSFESCVLAAAQLWSVCGRGPWTKGDYSCRRPES